MLSHTTYHIYMLSHTTYHIYMLSHTTYHIYASALHTYQTYMLLYLSLYTHIHPRVCLHVYICEMSVVYTWKSDNLETLRAMHVPESHALMLPMYTRCTCTYISPTYKWVMSPYTSYIYTVLKMCVHVLSLSRSLALSLSLSLSKKKMLYSTRLQVQERPPKDTQLE